LRERNLSLGIGSKGVDGVFGGYLRGIQRLGKKIGKLWFFDET
jgi:hypothetical protein